MVELSNPADSVRSFNFPCKIKDDVVMNLPPHTHTHNHTHTYLSIPSSLSYPWGFSIRRDLSWTFKPRWRAQLNNLT